MSRSTLLVSLVTAGCYADVEGQATALFPQGSDSGGASSWVTSTGVDASAASGLPATTSDPHPATPGSGEPWSTTTGEPVDEPPEILLFEIEPHVLHEAGAAEAFAVVSPNVTHLHLSVTTLEIEEKEFAPSEFTWSVDATSKANSNGTYELLLTAEDDKMQKDQASATLVVMLPDTGTQRCVFEEDIGSGWLTAVVYGDALVVAGALAAPSLEATVWRLDPDTCAPQFGSPWQISQWTELPEVQPPSQAVGLAVDAEGRTAIAANIGSGLARRPYIAVLSPEGSLEWERLGAVGQTYSGITASPDGFFVVGEALVNELPPRYDGFIEGFGDGGTMLWSATIAAPLPGDNWTDDLNIFDEHPRAVAWSEKLNVLVVVGERYIFSDNSEPPLRAFSVQYKLNNSLTDAWTSSGLDAAEDGLVAVTTCGEDMVASGWIQPGKTARSPAARWLDPTGDGDAKRRLDPLENTTFYGIACDRENKFTTAASTATSAAVVGFQSSDDPFLFKHDVADAGLQAADCDGRGFCAVAGLRGDRAWVRVHHP
ncbi:hypothetical protein SAMN02745121_01564 [Nannocystis exedens]|uniref:Uncharacterized protein n=1 Tax=Nannocystis exedens TaxID=54 RepID=A0A1I1V5S2_9BACT|nr:hypothetical protein [Nannocystis exedens]PCC72361.1 hypothetical protein NAEX_05441 [Nannocystis exedens]SFD78239.1 hypothetical protein SAMN02745121_01564 [Nannocystis exedens]